MLFTLGYTLNQLILVNTVALDKKMMSLLLVILNDVILSINSNG